MENISCHMSHNHQMVHIRNVKEHKKNISFRYLDILDIHSTKKNEKNFCVFFYCIFCFHSTNAYNLAHIDGGP